MEHQDHSSQKTFGYIPLRKVQKTRVSKIHNFNKTSELDFIEETSVKDSC